MKEPREVPLASILDQIESTHRERHTPGATYVSDRRMLEFIEYHLPRIIAAARNGIAADRPMLTDTEPRRLTDDELGGRAALEAAGLEPVDG